MVQATFTFFFSVCDSRVRSWHLLEVKEAPENRGTWLVIGILAPTLFCWAQNIGGVGLWFSLSRGRVSWAVEVAGIGWGLDVGSLFSLSLVLVSILWWGLLYPCVQGAGAQASP